MVAPLTATQPASDSAAEKLKSVRHKHVTSLKVHKNPLNVVKCSFDALLLLSGIT